MGGMVLRQGSVAANCWALFFCQNFAGILPCTPKCLFTASGKFLCYGCRSEGEPNRGTPLHRTYRRRITARGINSVRSCSKLINGHAVPIHASLTRWAMFLPWGNIVFATLAEIHLLLIALVLVVVPLAVVVAGVIVVPLAVVAGVIVAALTIIVPSTKYSDGFIRKNRFIESSSYQFIQGLLLLQQHLLLVKHLLNHRSLPTKGPLNIRPRLIMLELHMPF